MTKYAISGSGANASFPGSGFSARVYRDVTGEIVIAYAGTQFGGSGAGQAGDWLAGNMPLAVGLLGPQAVAAAELYQRVVADLGNNITFTGHSLGGGLAAMMAVYFDRPAKVFAPAPFGKSADPTQYALGALGPLAAIKAKLFANALADPHLVGIPQALADFSPGGDYTARSARVQAWAVKGEILEKTLFLLPFIETTGTRTSLFTAGETELGMTAKHSIDLHAAGLMSPTFNRWASTLTGILPLIFDRTFYAVDLITGDKQDFLVTLNRNQLAIAGNTPKAMLSHFANDLQKMGTNMAGLNRAAQDALTAQGIEWYYWQESNYAGQEFFTQTGNLLQYTSAQGAGLDRALNKAVRYVDPWLNPIASAHGIFAEVVNYDQWNVVTGSEGAIAAARDGSKTQIFIGGAGGDSLTGGSSADTFYAGEGNDTLDGGAGVDLLAGGGGADTYQFSGAFGSDTIVDSDGLGSILVDGGTLQGGKKVEGLENVWRNREQGYTFALAGSGADRSLRITKDGSLNAIRVKGWQNGQLGLTMDTSTEPPPVVQHIYNGDQRPEIAFDAHGTPYYDWSSTVWAPDGTLVGGVTEANYPDVIFGTYAGDRIAGLGGKDVLQAWLGDDEIDGGAGDDLIAGGPGRDIIRGGAGDDIILGAGIFYYLANYNNYSYSSVHPWDPVFDVNVLSLVQFDPIGANEWVNGVQTWIDLTAPDPDVIDAGTGDDLVFGSSYDDAIAGDTGDDVLWGLEGNDIMAGGAGRDILIGDVDGVDYAYYQSLGGDIPPVIYGKDFLDGGDGNDVLLGGGAGDILYGGAGNDVLAGDDSSALFIHGSYVDQLVAQNQQGDDFLDGGDGDDSLVGAGGNDVLIGGAGADRLDGGNGDDSFSAGAGDTVIDSQGVDTLVLADGPPLSVTAEGADLLLDYGNLGNLRIVDALLGSMEFIDGIRAGDWLNAHLGDAVSVESTGENQSLGGGAGNDTLASSHAGVRLSGGKGNDSYILGNAGALVDELAGEGTDTVQSSAGHTLAENIENLTLTGTAAVNGAGNTSNNILIGNAAANTLAGGFGNDTLNGGDGDDRVYGEEGNDLIYTSRGNDTLSGGDGLDTYVLGYNADRNTVIDGSAEGSVIKLGSAGMKFEGLSAVRRGNDLVVEVHGTSAAMRIKDYYASAQTFWVFEDAEGKTTTGEALVEASRTDWASLQSDLLKDFQSNALGSISRSYLDNGFTQRTDGSWYQPSNYVSTLWSNRVVRTEHTVHSHQLLADLNAIWYTEAYSVVYSAWDLSQAGTFTEDTTVTLSTQANAIDGDDIVLQSYNESSSIQAAWGAVQWSLGDSGHYETDWVGELGYFWPTEHPTECIAGNSRVESVYHHYDGTSTALTFQDPGETAVTGNLPDYVAIDFIHTQQIFNIGPSLLADGDHTVWADANSAVIGGVGNNIIHDAGFAYGGAGNAQLIGGGILMAGTGAQYLEGGKTMVVGDGHDTVVGRTGSHILVNPDNRGVDLIAYDFNPETDVDYRGASRTIEIIYQALGYADWNESYAKGGQFFLHIVDTFGGYFDSLEDARAAFDIKPRWLTFDEATARNDTEWRYVQPLTVLYTTPYSSFGAGSGSDYPASPYYDTHPLPAVVLTADNFAALQPLIDAGRMPGEIIIFGPGLALADLALSWGEATAPLDGTTHTTLDILWGADQGIRLMMPHVGDALNSVVQRFEFADGTVSSLLDLIAMVPLAPALDLHTGYFRTYRGTAGADMLAGTTGVDILNGGAGDDVYTISNSDDMAQEEFSEGFDTAVSTVDYTIRAHIENLVLTGTAVKGTGNALGNTLIGNRGANRLTGSFGADTLIGGDGDDMLDGPAGDDASTVWMTVTSDNSAVYTVYGSPAVPLTLTSSIVPGVMPGGSLRFEGGIPASARIYVTPGSQVDLGNVGMNAGSVYLSGKFADYHQAVDQNTGIYTFSRELPGGQSERLKIKAFSMNSSLYFTDGYVVLNSGDSRLVSTTGGMNSWEWSMNSWGWNMNAPGWGYENLSSSQRTHVFEAIQETWLTAGERAWPVDIPVISQGADRLVGGLGNDLYFVDEAGDAVVENAGEGSDTVQSCLASYTLGDDVENLTLLGYGNTNGSGNALANVLGGNAGNNTLAGGHGGDTYQAYRGMGQDRIAEDDTAPGTIDALSFGEEVSASQLWMRRIGNDLEINIIGTADKAAVQDWYLGSAHHVEQIKLSDGKMLLDSDAEILVQAMASFAPPAMGQTDLPPAYAAQLAPVIAASWH